MVRMTAPRGNVGAAVARSGSIAAAAPRPRAPRASRRVHSGEALFDDMCGPSGDVTQFRKRPMLLELRAGRPNLRRQITNNADENLLLVGRFFPVAGLDGLPDAGQ